MTPARLGGASHFHLRRWHSPVPVDYSATVRNKTKRQAHPDAQRPGLLELENVKNPPPCGSPGANPSPPGGLPTGVCNESPERHSILYGMPSAVKL